MKLSDGYRRCDVVADRYFSDILKENLRKKRGLETEIIFSGETNLLSDFKGFLGNSDNKSRLNEFLVKKFHEKHTNQQTFVVTFQNSAICNDAYLYDDDDISICQIEEVDQRIVCHVVNCIRNRILSIVICTNDTDVLILLVANFPSMLQINGHIKVFCLFGTDEKKEHFY